MAGKLMSSIRFRQLRKLQYGSPEGFLREWFRAYFDQFARVTHEEFIKLLRTSDLKPAREMLQAAIFLVGINKRYDIEVRFAVCEDEDYDFAATFLIDDTRHYSLVQLKELVPRSLNPSLSIDAIVASLMKYNGSKELVVAIYMNRDGRFDPTEVAVPVELSIGQLWMYSDIGNGEWALWGDFMDRTTTPIGTQFRLPNGWSCD
jgi:hypothetical protein